jgi:hypothetical protein
MMDAYAGKAMSIPVFDTEATSVRFHISPPLLLPNGPTNHRYLKAHVARGGLDQCLFDSTWTMRSGLTMAVRAS